MNKWTLLPGVQRMWREGDTLQIGLDPERSVTLQFTDRRAARVLGLLDGSRSETELVADATELGIAAESTKHLFRQLLSSGLLIESGRLDPPRMPPYAAHRLSNETAALALRDPPVPHRRGPLLNPRHKARVQLVGQSRFTAPIGALLAASGLRRLAVVGHGTVDARETTLGGLLPGDLDRPRSTAATDAIRRAAPEADTRAMHARPDVVVVAGAIRPVQEYQAKGVPHLAVWIRDGTVVVGPFVRPGTSACLRCVDLHRTDRDPAWPALAAQFLTEPGIEPCEAVVLAAGAALAARQVLSQLDGGDPEALNATLEIDGGGWDLRRREWTAHPRCGCRQKWRTA